MGLRRKNKGFTLIELMVVIAVTIILLGILIGNMGEQRQKYDVEETASAIRDYILNAGDTANKIQQDVIIVVSPLSVKAQFSDGTTDLKDLKNFEGAGGSRDTKGMTVSWDVKKIDSVMRFSHTKGTNLMKDTTGTLTLNIKNITDNNSMFVLRPKGNAYYTDTGYNATPTNNVPCIFLKKGNYQVIIEVLSGSNVRMYTCHHLKDRDVTTEQYSVLK